ncbi:CD1871A family CXXC motif-containing protein [Thermodesulfitimonas sp.]
MHRFSVRLQGRRMALAGVIFGLFLLVVGLERHEALALLHKGARICLECIGLG